MSTVIFLSLLVFAAFGLTTVREGNVVVITIFGKFWRVLRPGLNWRVPLLEHKYTTLSTQHQSMLHEFQAITRELANVYFKTQVLYSVADTNEQIKLATFKFNSRVEFEQAVSAAIESTIKGHVKGLSLDDVAGMNEDAQQVVKDKLSSTMLGWGYNLYQLNITDIAFDFDVEKALQDVVSGYQFKKVMDALGDDMAKFKYWNETLKYAAEKGEGNTIFLDAGQDGPKSSERRLMSVISNPDK